MKGKPLGVLVGLALLVALAEVMPAAAQEKL